MLIAMVYGAIAILAHGMVKIIKKSGGTLHAFTLCSHAISNSSTGVDLLVVRYVK